MHKICTFRSVVLLSFLAVFIFFVSCNNRSIRKDLKQMMNYEITIPHLHHTIFNGKDTIMHFSNEASVNMYKELIQTHIKR